MDSSRAAGFGGKRDGRAAASIMDPKARIIGFSGRRGVGKNFLAGNVLPDALRATPLSYMAFSDQIKVEVGARNPHLPFGDLFGEKTEPEVCRLLQDHEARIQFSSGDAAWIRAAGSRLELDARRRAAGVAAWIRAAELRLELDARRRAARGEYPAVYVFTDVRFPAEAEWIRRVGGVLVRVEAPDRNAEWAAAGGGRNFSETSPDDCPHFDFAISNERGRPREALELELREGILGEGA